VSRLKVGKLTVGVAAWAEWLKPPPCPTQQQEAILRAEVNRFIWRGSGLCPGILAAPEDHAVKFMETCERDEATGNAGVDLLVCMPAWGREYRHFPEKATCEEASLLVRDCLAQVIVGSHPRVVQPLLNLGAKDAPVLCCYSAGEAVSKESDLCESSDAARLRLFIEVEVCAGKDKQPATISGYVTHAVVQYNTSSGPRLCLLDEPEVPEELRSKLRPLVALLEGKTYETNEQTGT